MGIAERRAREKDELRRKILDTATGMFLQEGYHNVSMRKIAERIEYAPSTIYLHFKDKPDLVANICADAFAELDRRLEATMQLGKPPLETLRLSLQAYIEFGLEHPGNYIFVFCTPYEEYSSANAEETDSILRCSMTSFNRLKAGLQACMDSGDLRPADLDSAAQTTWLAIHGITAGLAIMHNFPFLERKRLIADFLDRVLAGLK